MMITYCVIKFKSKLGNEKSVCMLDKLKKNFHDILYKIWFKRHNLLPTR